MCTFLLILIALLKVTKNCVALHWQTSSKLLQANNDNGWLVGHKAIETKNVLGYNKAKHARASAEVHFICLTSAKNENRINKFKEKLQNNQR